MPPKPRPRYPNRDKVVLRRFISQILFLLFGVGLAVFYMLFNNSGEEQDDGAARDVPAIMEQAAGLNGSPPGGAATPGPGAAGPGSVSGHPPAVPQGNSATAPAPQSRSSIPGAQATPGAPAASSAPFAGQSIDQVAAALAERFGNRSPAAWGERLDGVTTRLATAPQGTENSGPPVLALTLDACGGKKGASYDARLVAFLREHRIPATLFVTSLWMRTNPDILAELAADPLFEIAAHGSRHRPCSVSGKSVYGIKGTANFKELAEEVEGNLRDLERATGERPRWFRSGTAYYDDIAVAAIHALGCGIAGYSIAGDEGATLPAAKVAAKTLAARDGDILLYHMNKPRSGTRDGLMKALPQLLERGCRFVRLSDLL